MKPWLSYLLMISIIIAPLTTTAATATYRGDCTVTFQVQKTMMKDFTGHAACEPFAITVTDNRISIPVISIQVATMETGNSKRDREMRIMFEYQTYPRITAETEDYISDQPLTTEGHIDGLPKKLTFVLTIRDITQRVTATVTEPRIDSSAIEATLVFDLSLAAFELNPPTFMGIVKVKDNLQIRAKVSLAGNPSSTFIPLTRTQS